MTKALVWIRKSEGSDDDIGLELQREQLTEVADERADEYDVVDLGVHTGFSTLTRSLLPTDNKDEYIDENDDVKQALEQLQSGEYDLLISYDPSRLARDGYLFEVRRCAAFGGCEIEYFADDVPEDQMVRDIMHIVEWYVKLREIRKSLKAKLKRRENGSPDGRPPFGFEYNEDKTDFVIDTGEFDTALTILEMDSDGASQREIARNIEPSRATVRKVLNNKDRYLSHAAEPVKSS